VRHRASIQSFSATCVAAAFTLGLALALPVTATQAPGDDDLDLDLGAEVYRSQCQPCHGSKGKGDGPASRFVDPKPRDLTQAEWLHAKDKTLGQVVQVVSHGVDDTGMEPFDELLTEAEIRAVAAYVLHSFVSP